MGGKVSCTLGEVKNRADFMIYWGGNPAECHPRHFTKYTLTQKGKFVPNGRKGRTMVRPLRPFGTNLPFCVNVYLVKWRG